MTVEELYANIGGNYENAKRTLQMDKLIAKFILKFLDEKSCEKLMTAGAEGDEEGIFEGAHALKGVCANLGLDDLSAWAGIVAEAYRPGKPRTLDAAALAGLLERIKADYDKVIAGIQQFAAESQ